MLKEKRATFIKYVIPSTLTTLTTGLYMTVDAIFVGRGAGEESLAAVNIANPIITLFAGIIILLSAGGATFVSKSFGAKDTKLAKSYFKQTLTISVITSIVLTFFSIFFAGLIVKNLGGSTVIQNLTKDYLVMYMAFFVFNAFGITLGYFVRADGRPGLSMIAMVSGGVSNIILDYIFIIVFKQGVKGAAFATGLGQCISLIILMEHFILKKGKLKISFGKINLTKFKEIFFVGFPVFMAEATYALYVIFTNIAISNRLGDNGLTAFSIINIIVGIINWILFGLTGGIQPIVSYSYGKKEIADAFYYVKTCIKAAIGTSIVFMLGAVAFQNPIIRSITDNEVIVELAKDGMFVTLLAQAVLGTNLSFSFYYQSIEQPKIANIISILRVLIVYPIILFGLTYFVGSSGIYVSLIIAEIIALFIILKFFPIKKTTYKLMGLKS